MFDFGLDSSIWPKNTNFEDIVFSPSVTKYMDNIVLVSMTCVISHVRD